MQRLHTISWRAFSLRLSGHRHFSHSSQRRAFDTQQPANVVPGGPPTTPASFASQGHSEGGGHDGGKAKDGFNWRPILDVGGQTVAGLGLVALAGISYYHFYKWHVLYKIAVSFDKGFDPVLELDKANAKSQSPDEEEEGELWFRRPEQELLERIVMGAEVGSYYLILGPKGTGKTSMLIEAMRQCEADGVSLCEAHEDPEVFRLRLGKCLNFEFYEDSLNGLFQRKDPREAGAILDIERALNKLEKVAIRYRKKRGRPLVLIFNNIHYLRNVSPYLLISSVEVKIDSLRGKDEQGAPILHCLQQRAESWAQAGVLTMVFNSDDAWIFDKMKKFGSRMRVLSISDLDQNSAMKMIKAIRLRHFGEKVCEKDAFKIWDIVGGRPSYLARVVRQFDMEQAARELVDFEANWLEAKLGLIVDCDLLSTLNAGLTDIPVMDEQKFSSSSFLLFQELVKRADDLEEDQEEGMKEGHINGFVPYGDDQADFLPLLDNDCIVTIDVNHNVRADSRLMLNAMRKLVYRENSKKNLDSVRERIDEIESLHRTAELTWKDKSLMRIRVARDKQPDPPEDGEDKD
ncbi:hypothetical protein BT69DRAFT_1340018 [Atractiella rhizophila]|nr:hypothetical protein BT69DRAFT_1340018 [Atractiella rhizophila]